MNDNSQWQTWRRKRNRLDRDVYRSPGVFAVTVSTWGRQEVFADAVEVQHCYATLSRAASTGGFRLLAYCFMPDHLHLLVQGSEESDLAELMKKFKQASSFEHKQRTGRPLWQRSYYDHVLRGEKELGPAVQYILGNAVRAGLAQDPGDYPFLGGELLERTLVAT